MTHLAQPAPQLRPEPHQAVPQRDQRLRHLLPPPPGIGELRAHRGPYVRDPGLSRGDDVSPIESSCHAGISAI
jgi:hypothetical protein